MVTWISFLAKLTRWKDWYEKMLNVFVAGYTWVLLSYSLPDAANLASVRLLRLLVFAAAYLAFVFTINDFYDKDIDKKAGKTNTIGELSLFTGVSWLIGLFAIGVLVLAPYYQQSWVISFVVLSYISAITYSAPPLRFKERRLAGLLVAATHRALPVLIGIAVFQNFQPASWFLFATFFLLGVRWNILHQLKDLPNDELTQTDTFVRTFGGDRSFKLMTTVVFPLELSCLLTWLVLASVQVPLLLLIPPAYGIWLLIVWREGIKLNWTAYRYAPLINFYRGFCPLFLGVLLVFQHPIYLPLLCLHIIWYQILRLIRFYSILAKEDRLQQLSEIGSRKLPKFLLLEK